MAIVMLALFATILEIFTVRMCMEPILNLNMLIDSLYATSYLMAIVLLLALYVIVCEIFTAEMCWTLTFKIGQGRI